MVNTGAFHTTFPQPDDRWRRRAACRGVETALFFPPKSDHPSQRVRALCRSCPVRQPCAVHALQFSEYGVWGGLTESERTAILRGQPHG